ncbi:MAG: RHS repeat-associated core domain-containing protein [Prevotella sp.]|jgi:RHS repeat-associated protein|nr:RHS repeat-associated core domain-containing protein [Prevotella sp.]
MTKDLNKGITKIQYNSLNLPYELLIKKTDVSGKIYYTYSASGVKLKTKHLKAKNLGYTPVTGTEGDSNFDVIGNTDYVGNKVYEDGSLKRILVNGGYIESSTYHYYLTDHLGNNRMTVNQNGVKTQWNHYYPFGMAFADKFDNGSKQPYKYNGKELDQMHGLNLYDYSARYYEPAIGRFTTVDPHAENYYSWSPYAYVGNNPIRLTDPTGMDWFVEKESGNVIFVKGIDNLANLDLDLREIYGIKDVEGYSRLGADDMFGDNVIYGEETSNVLEASFLNMGDDSNRFMKNNGYNKVISATEGIYSQRTWQITDGDDFYTQIDPEFTLKEKTEWTYVEKDKTQVKKVARESNREHNFSGLPMVWSNNQVYRKRTDYLYSIPKRTKSEMNKIYPERNKSILKRLGELFF